MTKHEIATKYVPCRCDEIYTNRGLTAPDCPYHSTDVESAMDEWAEQVAKKFAKWMFHGRWEIPNSNPDDQNYWTNQGHEWPVELKSTEDLYKLFLQSV